MSTASTKNPVVRSPCGENIAVRYNHAEKLGGGEKSVCFLKLSTPSQLVGNIVPDRFQIGCVDTTRVIKELSEGRLQVFCNSTLQSQ